MVKLLRIDDRLLHGQVAVAWTGFLGVDTILIANNKLITDQTMQIAFKMAKPPEALLSMKSLEGAVAVLNNPKHAARKMLVVVGSPEDAAYLCKKTSEIKDVMIGGVRDGKEKKKIQMTVYLDNADMQALEEIHNLGIGITLQAVPTSQKLSYEEIQKEYQK